ncbi:MAG: response regulator [Pseudomonadota bacterium]
MNLRVLVVDDEPGVASTLQAYMEDEGIEVLTAGSGEEALELVNNGAAFDVCIMDLRLPGMDGDAAILNLHRLRPKLKYLIHTGTAGYEVSDDLRGIGVENLHIFKKPLPDMAPLVAAVRTLVAATG